MAVAAVEIATENRIIRPKCHVAWNVRRKVKTREKEEEEEGGCDYAWSAKVDHLRHAEECSPSSVSVDIDRCNKITTT